MGNETGEGTKLALSGVFNLVHAGYVGIAQSLSTVAGTSSGMLLGGVALLVGLASLKATQTASNGLNKAVFVLTGLGAIVTAISLFGFGSKLPIPASLGVTMAIIGLLLPLVIYGFRELGVVKA